MTEPSATTPDASTNPAAQPAPEQHRFQAEVSQVLHLVIHSLYSHKEIFLRELISNASDALDRLRFRSITEAGLVAEGEALEIRILPDRERGTLTIEDAGVGMTKEELVKDLGTVARSGSKAFLEALQKTGGGQKDLSLIGQFGVGFYSAYLVADKVEVVSRAAGASDAWRWISDATESFTIEPAERPSRGTAIVLHLKKDQREFLEGWRLKSLVTRYSDYVSHPIKLLVDKTEGEGKEAKKTTALEQVNRASALWQRPKSEITPEQYDELYQHLTRDTQPPLARTHFKVEGTQEFSALLFVPRHPPFELRVSHKARGVQLFVKRVLIMEECEDLLPEWLRFVRGVVDSDDLPLNVSREILQDSQTARTIKKQLVKATLDMLDALAEKKPEGSESAPPPEGGQERAPSQPDYEIFWEHFGVMLKEGLAVDFEHKDRLSKLVRWESSKSTGLTSLADYVRRMPLRQEAIYYVLGESREAVESSPHLEELKKRGYEVLYMTDPVDEWAAEGLGEYEAKKVVSAMRADLKLEETAEQKKDKEESTTKLRPLLDKMKSVLGDAVVDVRVSERLTESPCCLVLAGDGPHAYVDRLLRERGKNVPHAKRALEINPNHPVVVALSGLVEKEPDAERLKDWILVLYDQALLTEGSALVDPNRFARRVTALMTEAAKLVAL